MIRVALAQLNQVVGDIAGNAGRIVDGIERARYANAQVAVFPELAVTGYPPEDLILKRSFVTANRRALDDIARHTGDLVAVVGFVEQEHGAHFNAAALCTRGAV